MEGPIPESWIKAVVRILRTGSVDREILITLRALQEWEATVPESWPHELVDTIRHALERGDARGKRIEGMADPGETYAFWIHHGERKLYAKVCLLEGAIKVKVISAHRPLKGEDRL